MRRLLHLAASIPSPATTPAADVAASFHHLTTRRLNHLWSGPIAACIPPSHPYPFELI
jgi:hypothetical protein